MIRMTQHDSATAAKQYYRMHLASVLGDYYGKDVPGEAPVIGQTGGKLAKMFGIEGNLTEEQFHQLIDNINPITGESLTKRTNADGNRRVGFDLYLDLAGKSPSVYFARTRDPLITRIFDEEREAFLKEEIEPRMMVRVRQNGQNESRAVGNMIYNVFPHSTTRPTRIEDPETGKWIGTQTADINLHQHIYILNCVHDPEYVNKDGTKGAVLAAEMTDGIWSQADYLQQNWHARLAKRFRDEGFALKRTKTGFDFVGFDQDMDKLFSRRKYEIEAWAEKHGITDLEAKSKGGRATRSNKQDLKFTLEQQFNEWRARMDEGAWDSYLASATSDDSANWPKLTEKEAVDYGLAHSLERANSATLEEVLKASLDRGLGVVDVNKVKDELTSRKDVIQAKIGGKTYITTQARLNLETSVKDWAVNGQGTCLPLAKADFELRPFQAGGKTIELNANQKEAIETLLRSTSKVMTLRGDPGVGKTTALSQLIAGVTDNGGNIVPIGSTNNARDQMIQAGKAAGNELANAQNLAKFLSDEEVQSQLNNKSLVIIDEVTQAGLEDIKKLADIVEEKGARLLAVGDFRQLHSVPWNGKAFEAIHRSIGSAADITEIVRQKDKDYLRAVKLCASSDAKDVQRGFDLLVETGAVREIDNQKDRTEQAAQLYLDIAGEKKNTRGKKLDWTAAEKQNPAMYRSGQTVILGKGKKAQKLEVVGRDHGQVMVVPAKGDREAASPLNLSNPTRIQVYEVTYTDAILAVGTYKEGDQVAKKIRQMRKENGELGIEHSFLRLESTGFSNAEKQLKEKYEPGMLIEFKQKAVTMPEGSTGSRRKIWYGERFTISGQDDHGNLMMQDPAGHKLFVPLENADRFEVYTKEQEKIAVGDKIRMTANGRTLPKAGSNQGVRFSNNDVFTVKGFDKNGNPIIGNNRSLDKNFAHFRSGYFKVGFSTQGADASHVIVLDSKQAGRARSMEANLVAISRGKQACTLLTDDIKHYRQHAITRSSQRPSATELFNLAHGKTVDAGQKELRRIQEQSTRLGKLGKFAKAATDATLRAIQAGKERLLATKTQALSPDKHPEMHPEAS